MFIIMVAENLTWCKEEFPEWGLTGKGFPRKEALPHLCLCEDQTPQGLEGLALAWRPGLGVGWEGWTLPLTATPGTDPVVLKSILHSNPIIPAPGRLSLECIEWTLSRLELVDWVSIPACCGGFRFLWGCKGAEVSPLRTCSLESQVLFPLLNSHLSGHTA